MGELSAEAFADWLHPSDIVNHFYQQGMGNDEAEARTIAMLSDGLLQAAASQLIVNGKDMGLALIPRDLWPLIADTEVWSTGRFYIARSDPVGKGPTISISAYDVRIDRDIRDLPKAKKRAKPTEIDPASKLPLSDTLLKQWADVFLLANPDATEAETRRAIEANFPRKFVSRERLRRILPSRRRGRPLKDKE